MYRHLSFVFAAVIFAAISFIAFPATADHKPNHNPGGDTGTGDGVIDCAAGQTVGDALAAGQTNIVVLGTCDEAVEITTSNVTIEGHADGGAIIQSGTATTCSLSDFPTILVRGAHNVTIKNLTLSGIRHGLGVTDAGGVVIENTDITGRTGVCGVGVFITNGSYARIIDSSATPGINFTYQGMGLLFNTVVSGGNLFVRNGSTARVYGSTLDGLFMNATSNAEFRTDLLDIPYGPTTVTGFLGCNEFSTLLQTTGAVIDGSGAPIPLTSVSNDPFCIVTGF